MTNIDFLVPPGPNVPYEVAKARVQALLLSGRYRTELLCRHWSSNSEGFCLLPSCLGLGVKEDLEHILLKCGSLAGTRERLCSFTSKHAMSLPHLCSTLLTLTRPDHPMFCQFLLDCSVIPDVISLVQALGEDVLHHLFKVSRTWCYSLHRDRLKMLGRWNPTKYWNTLWCNHCLGFLESLAKIIPFCNAETVVNIVWLNWKIIMWLLLVQ